MRIWLEMNAVIGFTYLVFFILRPIFNIKGKYRFESYSFKALGFMLFFPVLLNLHPVDVPLPPVVKKQIANTVTPSLEQAQVIRFSLPTTAPSEQRVGFDLTDLFFYLALMGLLVWIVRLSFDIKLIRSMIGKSVSIKNFGKVKLYLSPELKAPCSFWVPGHFFALFPESVLLDKKIFSHALSHELQHHRQGDTQFIFLVEVLRGIFYINPFTHLWIKQFHENRELKCDREVLKRKGYQVREYGSTLIDVVNMNSGIILDRTWSMASLKKIKRRIEMMTVKKKGQLTLSKSVVCIGVTMLVAWQGLAASRNLIGSKEITRVDAEKMVRKIETTIPLEINESVLKWLNYFVANPKGKAYMIKSLERMHSYQSFLSQKIKKQGMPKELLAVPFMESGFENTAISTSKAAGIWQFIPETAKRFGLRVDQSVDERLNVDKQTDAAISYYKKLLSIKEFKKDWRLALIAYNSGERNLLAAMEKQKTNNPWAFSHLGDKEYLAKIVAGMILLKSPRELVFSNPLDSGLKTTQFGVRGKKRRFHGGLDIAAKLGTPILSPLSGVVKEAKFSKGHGNSIIIDHGNNIVTRYSHVQKMSVKKGEKVLHDQEVGTVGTTGDSTKPHLHFELMINGKSVDPEIFF